MKNFFTIFFNFINMSHVLKDFTAGEENIALATDKPLYIGYEKPFNQFFVALGVRNTAPAPLKVEFFNGTAYEEVEYLLDESNGFLNDGFIIFKKPTTWKKSLVENSDKYFIRVSTAVNHTAETTVKGIGVLFSNDLDLVAVRSNIVSKFNNGETWLGKHEQAVKEIMQELNNKGYRKVANSDSESPLVEEGLVFSDLNRFDILEPSQLRLAATYLVLSMIYLDELSDEDGDKWQRQGYRYQDKFNKAFNLFALKIDSNDNGVTESGEAAATSYTGLTWT